MAGRKTPRATPEPRPLAATASIDTPVGRVAITVADGLIVRTGWIAADGPPREIPEEEPLLAEACDQLRAYFDQRLKRFDLPLDPAGTGFQRQVWVEMQQIPYGSWQVYSDLADRVGSVARAVGRACGQNPIPIIIPCHRVLASGGRLGGYSGAGGRTTKLALLAHEGAMLPLAPLQPAG
mgnify:CR=1 FL=1